MKKQQIKPQTKVKLKRGDQVLVIAGKNKGKKSRILSVDRKNNRVIVEQVNMVSKHMKANRRNQAAGIVKKEAPIDVSNVMYLHKGEPTRIGYRLDKGDDGVITKVRIAKSTGEDID